MLNKFLCYFIDHKWEKTDSLVLSTGPLGCGTLVREECKRCGEQRINFHADVAFGLPKKRVKSRPHICRDICEANDANGTTTEEIGDDKAKKSTKGKTKAKVQKCPKCNQSEVS